MGKRKFLLSLLCIFLTLAMTACSTEPARRPSEIEIAESGKVEYSSSLRAELLAAMKSAAVKVYTKLGLSGGIPKRFDSAVLKAVAAFEKRGVEETDIRRVCSLITEDTDLLAALASGESNAEAVMTMLGAITSEIGVEMTSRIMYDLALIYCEYGEEKQLELYEYSDSKPEYLLKNAEAWREKRSKMAGIGEEDTASVVRLALSAVAVFSKSGGPSELDELIGAPEIAEYFRAEGRLLSGLSIDSAEAAFLTAFLGELGFSKPFSAVFEAGDSEKYAKHAPEMLKALSHLFCSVTVKDAEILENGELSSFLYTLASRLTDAERQIFESFFSSQSDSEAYIPYFKKLKADGAFSEFCKAVEPMTADRLWCSDKTEFYENFKKYLTAVSPAVAFAVFEL